MARNGLYTGIDIGTHTVKVLVAEYVSGEMNIIGNGNATSEGLKNGIIVDIEKAAASIRKAVNAAQEKAGITIDVVNVGVPSNQLGIDICQGMVQINSTNKEIVDSDVVAVVNNALQRGLIPEREIIAVEPREFTVDGFSDISDPRGMFGVRLEMRGTLYTGPKTLVHNIITAVERAGLTVGNIVIAPLTLSKHVLTEGERDFGTIMIDMGAGQTSVAAVKEGNLTYTQTRPEGGDYITRDISTVLNTSIQSAEEIKTNYGEANTERASQEEFFLVDAVGRTEPEQVSEYYLSGIVEARLVQIFEKVRQELESRRILDYPGGVVLLGGAAAMPGIVDVASAILGQNVRLYVPTELGLRNPLFAQVISIVDYISRRSDIEVLVTQAMLGIAPETTYGYTQTSVASADPILTGQYSAQADEQPTETPAEMPNVVTDEQVERSAPQDKQTGQEGIVNRIRGVFTNMFD